MGRRDAVVGSSGAWWVLRDEELLVPPGEATLTPTDPQVDLLPTDEMNWPSFDCSSALAGRFRTLVRATARQPAAQ